MVDRVKIGLFLAAVRKRNGLTQADLAERLGVSNKTVSRWETGQTMPDYSQVLNLCQLLNISVYDFLAGEFGAEARYMPKAREGSIQISSNNAAPAAAKAPDETPESPSPAPQESRKKKIATRFTEITLLLITGVLGIAVLLLGGIVIRNLVRPASAATPSFAPAETPFVLPSATPTATPSAVPTEEAPTPGPTPDDGITALAQQYTTHIYSGMYVTVLPAGTIPQELAGRKLSDEELSELKGASPEDLRAALSTVEDVIAWFRVTEPEIWDSDCVSLGAYFAYSTPESKLKDPNAVYAADSISIIAAWLLQDDYAGCAVLGACDVSNSIMNALCVCIPIDGGWYVFNMAACTEKGSFEDMLDAVVVRDLKDLHPYLAEYSRQHNVRMTEIALFEDLQTPIMFESSENEKHWVLINATLIPEP